MTDETIPGVDVADFPEPGYKPVLRSAGDWMVAVMNGWDDSWSLPDRIEKHPATDELFVLVAGRALMVSAGDGESPGPLRQDEMQLNVPYLVRAGIWHATPMTTDARFIIVERTGTEKEDGSVLVDLTSEQVAGLSLPEPRT